MSKELVKKIVKALDDKKAIKIDVIDIQELSQIADYFVVCTGSSTTQVKALADEVEFQLGSDIEHEVGYHKEGYGSAEWILLDYKDVIVHIFWRGSACLVDGWLEFHVGSLLFLSFYFLFHQKNRVKA